METTVAQKLDSLLQLQQLDSQLDDIRKMRGDLPEEVQDLEDEIAGYTTRTEKYKAEIASLKEEIAGQKLNIKEADKLIAKYTEQQQNVRNNREYDAISKEIESQELDIQIFEKRIREAQAKIEAKDAEIEQLAGVIAERNKDLEQKQKELEVLLKESEEEEVKLRKARDKAAKNIEDRLLFSYNRLRDNAANGLAVVVVKRGACGGCFNMVPPQRQADIKERKKLIVCEHCGRILADVESGETENIKKTVAGLATR